MDIDTKKSLLEKKLQQLRDGEKEPNDILEDIKFLIDFEECFDELQSNADACYTYEQMLKSTEDYIIETSSEEEKNFLQYKVLIPSILKMESAYLNGNFHMGTIGMNLCESYLKIADSKIMKVYLNELVYALENRDEDYAKKLKCTFQSGEANLDDLKDYLWDLYDKENKDLAKKIVNLIYANGKFDEPARKILEEFENREKEGNSNNEETHDGEEKFAHSDDEIGDNGASPLGEELPKEVSNNLGQEIDDEEETPNVQNSDVQNREENAEKRKMSKAQAEAEFSREHGGELKNLIVAMIKEDNQGVENLIGALKEFPTGSNLDNRILNLYNRNPKVAAKLLIELYNRGNGELDIDSSQLNSAKTATLEQRKSSIDEARGMVHSRSQQLQVSLSSIRENLTQPRLSTHIVQENIELLNALYKQATSTTSTREELDGIQELLNYANLELKQLKEMEAILAEDE